MKMNSEKNDDADIKKDLKKMDSWAARTYLIIPLVLLVIGGKKLASVTPLIWFVFSIIYIISFRTFLKSLSSREEQTIAKLSKTYVGHQISWVMLTLTSLLLMAVIVKALRSM
ncbi:hypothetical protein DXZ79_20550 (plasmid) [Yersinia rochesterensis]|uniref:Uncharacterized protein n=1 Tax=Yersinia rochesterensis TaxID=1604335 RepID=A0A8E4FZT7_9GAMM|nr:hypothetical protein DXZ79_20550 [Yersinia rochesterensis]